MEEAGEAGRHDQRGRDLGHGCLWLHDGSEGRASAVAILPGKKLEAHFSGARSNFVKELAKLQASQAGSILGVDRG